MVEIRTPNNLKDALNLRSRYEVIPYMGGTDLMVRGNKTSNFLFLNMIKELKQIKIENDRLIIGAAITYTELLEHKEIPSIFKKVISEIAMPATRNIGTLCGNICNASPLGDTLPLIYCFDGVVNVESLKGSKKIAIDKFIIGKQKTSLKQDEIVSFVEIPLLKFDYEYYKKVGPRKAGAISKLNFLGLIKYEENIVSDIRIALGCMSNTIIRNREIEKKYKGLTINELKKHTREIESDYEKLFNVNDDKRSTKRYREKVALLLIRDFIDAC